MKIAVDKIPEEGLELTEQIDSGRISSDLRVQGVDLVRSVDVKAMFTKSGTEVFVDIDLKVPCEYTCARCLAKVQNIFKKSFNVNYEVKPGDILEVDEDIRQEMILDSPMKFVCKADCKGLCPNCGQNINVGKCDCEKNAGPIKNRPLG